MMAVAIDREISIVTVYLLMFTYLWLVGLFFKAHKKSPENPVLFAFTFIFFFFFIGRFILHIFDFYLTMLNHAFYAENVFWWKAGMLIHSLGFVIYCFVVERQLFDGKDKYVFFIGCVISLGIAMVIPDIAIAELFSTLSFLFCIFIPVGMIKIAAGSKDEIRRRALYTTAGFLTYLISIAIVSLLPTYIFHTIGNCGQILAAFLLVKGYL